MVVNAGFLKAISQGIATESHHIKFSSQDLGIQDLETQLLANPKYQNQTHVVLIRTWLQFHHMEI